MDSEIVSNKLNNYFRNNIKLVSVSRIFIIIVTKDDRVYMIDNNLETFLVFNNNSNIENYIESKILNELCYKGVIDFKNNINDVIARNNNGQLYCYDRNRYNSQFTQYLSDKHITDICCGYAYSLVLTHCGQVYAWGQNSFGQIANPSNDSQSIPIKLNHFNNHKVIQISCGDFHSMALTESGRVFSWGWNKFGQLGLNNNNERVNKPSIVSLSNQIAINKISCGRGHSLLLSQNGDIYWFGYNGIEIQITPKKLTINSNKSIDIASHYNYDICVALMEDWIYFWGECKRDDEETDIISSKELKQTPFKTFEQFYNNFLGITHNPIHKLIDLRIKMQLTQNGKYKKSFEEIEKLGEGHYGVVVKVKGKYFGDEYAIKKIEFKSEDSAQLLKEVQIFYTIERTLFLNAVEFKDLWLENNCVSMNDNKNGLILYIQMELCDTTLKTVINQILEDSFICENKTLTLLGFRIASYIFFEILYGVNQLHKSNPPIIHLDLHSENILLKKHYDEEEEKYSIDVKIADFGLAKIRELAQKSQTVLPKSSSNSSSQKVSSDGFYTTKYDIYQLAQIMSQLFCIDPNR
jgi:alpha-tubulin suppressor-like RCC1 family protein